MSVTINGTSGVTTPGIANSEGYTGDGLTIAAGAPAGALQINSAGNAGLGVTPSAWDTTLKSVLQTGSAGAFLTGQGSSEGVYLGSNAYYNSGWKYVVNGYATHVRQQSGTFAWYTAPSGTAGNPITFTQAMTLDASGNLSTAGTLSINTGGLATYFRASGTAYTQIGDNQTLGAGTAFVIGSSTPYLGFNTAGSERARFDASGNLLVGTTSSDLTAAGIRLMNNNQVQASKSSDWSFRMGRRDSTGIITEIYYNSSRVGDSATNGTGTTYNSASDYHLKENVAPLTNALDKIAALKPVTYTWKADGSADRGFIAHELQEVIPQAVSGEKDAVDDKGNIMPQGVDYGKITPELVAAIQELKARIEKLEAK